MRSSLLQPDELKIAALLKARLARDLLGDRPNLNQVQIDFDAPDPRTFRSHLVSTTTLENTL